MPVEAASAKETRSGLIHACCYMNSVHSEQMKQWVSSISSPIIHKSHLLLPCLAPPALVLVMKDSPQPHWPLELGLINMNSDLP